MAKKAEATVLNVAGREVSISNPNKVLFPEAGYTKLDLVNYYLAVAEGALRGAGGRPNVLVRYPNGLGQEFFYQKRAPDSRPDWIEVVALKFPSGRTAEEVVPRDAAALAWMANLACLELHPHPVRAEELDHPDELRVDLDPVPGVEWRQVQDVAKVVRAALDDLGLVGWPKTSGSRGIHVNVRIHQRWTFTEVRRAALALAREVERRAPAIATSKWWKEERHGVFIDFNQNAKDKTVCSAFSVRPRPDARVSTPLTWEEIDACDPADFTLKTMPAWFKANGDRHAGHRSASVLARDSCSSCRRARKRKGRAMRRGRRSTRSSPVSRPACSRHGPGRPPGSGKARLTAQDRTAPRLEASADRHRALDEEGRGARALEQWKEEASGGRRAPSAGRHPDRLDARAIVGVVARPDQPAARAGRGLRPARRSCRRFRIRGRDATPEQIAEYREMHRKRRQARKPE